ncbi:MAG: redoxin domain-containing protein [Gammaproteobacteria bacterium]|nr:redoxin domain-containing protein [Gammaproteobacteria bacterium]
MSAVMKRLVHRVCLVLSALASTAGGIVLAGPAESIGLTSGFELQVQRFAADGRDLLIWVPSEYGIREGNTPFARTIQQAGIDYWLVDLHESYMATTGRDAYAAFEPAHVKELIDHAVQQGWQRIFLGGESRGAALAMQAARLWQTENPGKPALIGMLFYHPNLIEGYTGIGEEARFRKIARETNLPVYIFQPQFNTKYLHSRALAEQLQTGGSAVYLHFLQGVRGGFHVRDADRLNARETEERGLLGDRIGHAIRLLALSPPPLGAAEPADDTALPGDIGEPGTGLVAVNRLQSASLRLRDDDDRMVDLQNLDGEVVLVNFWASWCGPCVKEIGSLIRLVEHFDGRPFRVLTVNISEDRAHVADFFDTRDIVPNFQVLYDLDGSAARRWRVYAVPSTYLLDAQGRVRYGYRGALKWDRSDVIETVDGLLDEIRKPGPGGISLK